VTDTTDKKTSTLAGGRAGTAVKPKEKSKGLFFSKKKQKHPPERVLLDYKQGHEKAILESARAEQHALVMNLGFGKEGVDSRIKKVSKHPVLEDGYVIETQQYGDGTSYIEQALSAFEDPAIRKVWIPLKKGRWSYIQQSNGYLETYWSEFPPTDDGVILSAEKKTVMMKPLFIESYALFYISIMLLFAGGLSLGAAMLFKYVVYNEHQTMVNKTYYTASKYLPIETLRGESSTETERLRSVRYSQGKGWHFIKEKLSDDGSMGQFYQKIGANGEKEALIQMGTIQTNNITTEGSK
jgi:hypothetical protein